MRCFVILTIPIISLAIICGYYLNFDIPPEIEQPWIYRTVLAMDTAVGDLIKLYAYIHNLDALRLHMECQAWVAEHFLPGKLESHQVSMTSIRGISVRVWQPSTSGANRPAIIYIHGGGFIGGSIYMYEGLTRKLADDAEVVVFNVDYHLAFDHPSPRPLNDCYDVTTDVIKNAKKWNINPKKVIVSGDSAGGNLAAALALRMRDEEHTPPLAAQILIYPTLQGLDLNLPSYRQNARYTTSITPATDVATCILSYVNQSRDYIQHMVKNQHVSSGVLKQYGDLISHKHLPSDLVPPQYTPLRPDTKMKSISLERALTEPYNFPLVEEDLADLPPALVVTKKHDTLRDDGIIYSRRLQNAGNHVIHVHDNRGFHGDMCLLEPPMQVRVAVEITDKICDFIKNI